MRDQMITETTGGPTGRNGRRKGALGVPVKRKDERKGGWSRKGGREMDQMERRR